MGDKDAKIIVRENVLKWWRQKGYAKKIRLMLSKEHERHATNPLSPVFR